MPATSRPSALGPALVLLAIAAAPGASAADALSVTIDHAKVMHISRPADIVIVGNPGIADATIQDQQTLIITGRSYGSTNLIVLDSSGKAIAEETLTVEPSNDNVVAVYKTVDKRLTRQTFSCTHDGCSPTLAIGDEDKAFSGASGQIKGHGDFAKGPGQ
jgi:Pilus formation protein N terminal region